MYNKAAVTKRANMGWRNMSIRRRQIERRVLWATSFGPSAASRVRAWAVVSPRAVLRCSGVTGMTQFVSADAGKF